MTTENLHQANVHHAVAVRALQQGEFSISTARSALETNELLRALLETTAVAGGAKPKGMPSEQQLEMTIESLRQQVADLHHAKSQLEQRIDRMIAYLAYMGVSRGDIDKIMLGTKN